MLTKIFIPEIKEKKEEVISEKASFYIDPNLPLVERARLFWNKKENASPFHKVANPLAIDEGKARIIDARKEEFIWIHSLNGASHILHEQ